MRLYPIIPLFLLASLLSVGLLPIEKDFESKVNALALYRESIGADASSVEYYFYWGEGKILVKHRFLVTELNDGIRVRLLNDMYFDGDGKLALYTYWSGTTQDIRKMEKGLGPHFLAKGKCLFHDGKMVQWREDGALKERVPGVEWREMENYILHSAKGALEGWREILSKKKVIGPSSKTGRRLRGN